MRRGQEHQQVTAVTMGRVCAAKRKGLERDLDIPLAQQTDYRIQLQAALKGGHELQTKFKTETGRCATRVRDGGMVVCCGKTEECTVEWDRDGRQQIGVLVFKEGGRSHDIQLVEGIVE
jgi:hypothetical protein